MSMFATFAHATSSTRPIPPISAIASGRSSASAAGCTRTFRATAIVRFSLLFG